jgi:hypothetical protein
MSKSWGPLALQIIIVEYDIIGFSVIVDYKSYLKAIILLLFSFDEQ